MIHARNDKLADPPHIVRMQWQCAADAVQLAVGDSHTVALVKLHKQLEADHMSE